LPRVDKVKPNEDELKKPLEIPECEVKANEVWYPSDWFLITIHDMMIERYGGWTGFESGIEPHHQFIEEAKKTEGIYRKASVLLRSIATSRIFQDGHHRTAYIVIKTFLEKNDADFKEKDEQKIIRFIKDIRKHSIDGIEGWLENGEL
jgi:death-on-curing family protein